MPSHFKYRYIENKSDRRESHVCTNLFGQLLKLLLVFIVGVDSVAQIFKRKPQVDLKWGLYKQAA